jgi:hypothetical protein
VLDDDPGVGLAAGLDRIVEPALELEDGAVVATSQVVQAGSGYHPSA